MEFKGEQSKIKINKQILSEREYDVGKYMIAPSQITDTNTNNNLGNISCLVGLGNKELLCEEVES